MRKKVILLTAIFTALAVFVGCATEATGVDDSYCPEVNVPAGHVIGNTIPEDYETFIHDRTSGFNFETETYLSEETNLLGTDTHFEINPGVDFVRLGKLHREAIDLGLWGNEFSVNGRNIIISEQALNHHVKSFEVFGVYNVHDEVFETLTRDAVLYAEATSLGYTVSDREVQEQIEAEIEASKGAVNFDQMLTYFDAAQLTIEEYFQSRFEQRRRSLIIDRFLQSQVDTFMESKEIEDDQGSPGIVFFRVAKLMI
jgi:hypothetical protein